MRVNAFNNSVVLVTGAASGIGRELAIQAAQRGAHVLASDINSQTLEETRALANNKGLTITTSVLDVADPNAIETFVAQQVPLLHNRKLVLINNAGVALASGKFEHTSLDDFAWLLNINLWGAIRLTKAFYSYMLQQNNGHIVNLSSVFGLVGVENQTAYCTAKFGLRGFTETLRMELRGTGICTTTVHPGGIKTNIVRNARFNYSLATPETREESITVFDKQARTTAASAARQILDAVEKKKQRLVIGKDGVVLDSLARFLPVGYTRIIKQQIEKTFTRKK